MDAFKALCGGNDGNTLVVPDQYAFFVRQINFSGPCYSKNINIKVQELEAFTLILYLFHTKE